MKKKQLLEEVRTMLHAKSPGCGKNCSMTNSACKSHNTNKESKAGTTLQVKKTYAECVLEQPDTSIKSPSKPQSARDHIFSTVGKKQKTGENTAKPCSTSSEIDRQKEEEHDSEQTTITTKKPKHRLGKRDSDTLKAAQKPVVLFVSRIKCGPKQHTRRSGKVS